MTADVLRMDHMLAFNVTELARLLETSRDFLASRISKVEPSGRRSGHPLYELSALLPALTGAPDVRQRCSCLVLGLLAVHVGAVGVELMTLSGRVPRIREFATYCEGLVAGLGSAPNEVPAELAERVKAHARAVALAIADELAPPRAARKVTS